MAPWTQSGRFTSMFELMILGHILEALVGGFLVIVVASYLPL
jgi:hypothetical protein